MLPSNRPSTKFTARLAFLAPGFAVACWAPLSAFAKQKLGVYDGIVRLSIRGLGAESVASMIADATLNARYRAKPIAPVGRLGLSVALRPLGFAW
jgi:hypothetical protein